MSFEAILFDFDGVLADTEPIHYACWSEILARYGVRLGWDTYCRVCVGVADREMIRELAQLVDPPADFERIWAEYPVKKQRFRERLEHLEPVHGATIELLRSLAQFKLAVVSSSGRTEVEPVLVRAGVRELFDAVVFGEDVARLKPAPDPYLKAADILGVRSALVVEDSDAGIESARRAGFEALRVESPAVMPARVRARLGL